MNNYRFKVGEFNYSLADMLEANATDVELCDWLRNAKPGDVFPDGETCTCMEAS